jgi:hypothetical protein
MLQKNYATSSFSVKIAEKVMNRTGIGSRKDALLQLFQPSSIVSEINKTFSESEILQLK